MDFIIARQHPLDPACLQWRRERPDGETHASEGGWGDFAEQIAAARIVWLVPTEDVLLTQVDLPSRRELRRAAPYALEDELAEDIEALHFAYGKTEAGAPTPVAVVNRELMREWLDVLESHDVRPHALVPDVLALPWSPNRLSITLQGRRGLLRTGEASGMAADADFLPSLIDATLAEHVDEMQALDVWRAPDSAIDSPRAGIPVEESRWQGHLPALVTGGWAKMPPLNLLQGEFRPRRAERRHAQWWIAAAVAGVWLLAAFALDVMHYRELATLKTDYQVAMRDLYFATFPEARKAPDPRLLMEQRLNMMREGNLEEREGAFLALLNHTAQTLATRSDSRVTALRYRDGRLELELEAGDAGSLDALKQALEARGLKAKLQSVDAQESRVSGQLQVEHP